MTGLVPSRHADKRMRQRGMRPSDPNVILRYGSEVGGDIHGIYFLKRKDVRREINNLQSEIRRLKQIQGSIADMRCGHEIRLLKLQIHTLERLMGRKLVVAGGTIVTCYRSGRRDRRRISRRGRECA